MGRTHSTCPAPDFVRGEQGGLGESSIDIRHKGWRHKGWRHKSRRHESRRRMGRAASLILAFLASAIGTEREPRQPGGHGEGVAAAYAMATLSVQEPADGALGLGGFHRVGTRRGGALRQGGPARTTAPAPVTIPAIASAVARPFEALRALRQIAYAPPTPAGAFFSPVGLPDDIGYPGSSPPPTAPGPEFNPPPAPSQPPGDVICCAQGPTPPTRPVSPAAPDGVPEPAVWVIMLLGLGAIGATLRTIREYAPRVSPAGNRA
jgi:hypothetical protein